VVAVDESEVLWVVLRHKEMLFFMASVRLADLWSDSSAHLQVITCNVSIRIVIKCVIG